MSAKGAPFIPAWFDELELTASEFRLLAHLWRRADKSGACYPSVPTIIACCRVTENTVWKVLRSLEHRGLLKRERRLRTSNLYRLVIPDTAIETASGDSKTPQSERHQTPQSERHVTPQKEGCQTPQTRGWKGTPMKVPQERYSREGDGLLSTLPEKLSDLEVEVLSSDLSFEATKVRESYDFFRRTKLLFKADWAHLRRRDLPAAVTSFLKTDRRGKAWLEAHQPPKRVDYSRI